MAIFNLNLTYVDAPYQVGKPVNLRMSNGDVVNGVILGIYLLSVDSTAENPSGAKIRKEHPDTYELVAQIQPNAQGGGQPPPPPRVYFLRNVVSTSEI